MRRFVTVTCAVLLSGCAHSGFYAYLGDTFQPPLGRFNPNAASGSGETYQEVRGNLANPPAPILYEAGDVWPPPPKAPPTLKDLQAQAQMEQNGTGHYAPLQPLPSLPGFEVPQPQTPQMAAPAPSFPNGVVPVTHGRAVRVPGSNEDNLPGGAGPVGNVVVPNGNGTSTVISPTGKVTTIPTPGR